MTDRKSRKLSALVMLLSGVFLTAQPHADTKKAPMIRFTCQMGNSSDLFISLNKLYTNAFKDLGYDFLMESQPNVRSVFGVEKGYFDGNCFRVEGYKSPAENSSLVMIDVPVATLVFGAWTLTSKNVVNFDIKSLKTERVGYPRGAWILEDLLNQKLSTKLGIGIDQPESAIQMLLLGRIDYYVDHQYRMNHALSKIPRDVQSKLINVGSLIQKKVYPYLHNKHAEIAVDFSAAIQRHLEHEEDSGDDKDMDSNNN